ncbi:MAG: hypothetical protein ACREIB_07105, partial [Pseudomonadota bacterium]
DCEEVMPKDGTGTGANSWIGYVAGSNQATGNGSAVTDRNSNATSASILGLSGAVNPESYVEET